MNLFMVLAAAQAAVDLTPSVSGVAVSSLQSGVCSGSIAFPAASINVEWSSVNFDPEVHEYKLYENDVLKVSTTDTSWSKTITGQVENGTFSPWQADWTYRVDIVDTGTGVVLASMQSEAWQAMYGSCHSMEP